MTGRVAAKPTGRVISCSVCREAVTVPLRRGPAPTRCTRCQRAARARTYVVTAARIAADLGRDADALDLHRIADRLARP